MPPRAPSPDRLDEQIYRHEVEVFRSKANRLEGLRFLIEHSERLLSLHQSSAFLDVLKALKLKADAKAEKLMKERHDDYQQGRSQGYLEAMYEFVLIKPLDQDQVEKSKSEIDRLVAELREKQRLLEFIPEIKNYPI